MRNRKFATHAGLGCSFWILAVCIIGVGIALTYAVVTSDLPDWLKYLILA